MRQSEALSVVGLTMIVAGGSGFGLVGGGAPAGPLDAALAFEPPSSYAVVVDMACFCPRLASTEIVVDGEQVLLAPLETENWGDVPADHRPTVAMALEELDRASHDADALVVRVDDVGRPTRIDIDWDAETMDDEVAFELTWLDVDHVVPDTAD